MTEQMPSNIYTAINAVMREVGYVKKTRASGLNYTFAGEASLIAALRPEMVDNGIFVTVSKIDNVVTREYRTASDKAMVNVALVMTLRFTHTSGSYVEVEAAGEGSDTGDKATAKAMTAAYKYALRETFCIETGDDPDKHASEDRAPATRTNGNGTVQRPPTPAAGNPPAAAAAPTDNDELAPANFAGFSKWDQLRAQAQGMQIKVDTILEPMKVTKGQVRAAYAVLKARVAAELQRQPA
jgi:hypothetical protein